MKLQSIGESVYIAGGLSRLRIENEILMLLINKGIEGTRQVIFKKLFKNKVLFTSQIYTRAKRTNSSFVRYVDDNILKIGQIQLFLKIMHCHCRNLCQCQANYYVAIKKYASNVAFPQL